MTDIYLTHLVALFLVIRKTDIKFLDKKDNTNSRGVLDTST